MTRVLAVICLSNFFAASGQRITEPVLPQIAGDLSVEVQTAALLATAFALPWIVAQPIFGPLGDLIGKVRVIRFNLVLLVLSTLGGAFATTFPELFAARVIAGVATAGVMPVGFALTGDLTPASQRAVSVGRIVGASMAGQLLGAVVAGLIGDMVGWRGVFTGTGLAMLAAAVLVFVGVRGVNEKSASSVNVAAVLTNYRSVFANPLAKVCFGAVFLEGIAIFGVLPYVAPLLVTIGESRAIIAGFIVSGFALGAFAYSFLVPLFIARLHPRRLMVLGAVICTAGLMTFGALPPWPVQVGAFAVMGFGFYMLHNCIQVQMMELAPHARGSAVAMHASTFFAGQALGPVLFGLALAAAGAFLSTVAAGILLLGVGIIGARLLYGRSSSI